MTHNSSSSDSTIRDIHAIREQLSDKFGGDIAAILADARQRQSTSGRRILQRGELSKTVVPPVSNSGDACIAREMPVAG